MMRTIPCLARRVIFETTQARPWKRPELVLPAFDLTDA